MALKATRITGPYSPPCFIMPIDYSAYWTYTTRGVQAFGSGATGVSVGVTIRATASCKFEIDRWAYLRVIASLALARPLCPQFRDVAERRSRLVHAPRKTVPQIMPPEVFDCGRAHGGHEPVRNIIQRFSRSVPHNSAGFTAPNTKTTVPTQIIPVIFVMTDGGVFDPTAPDPCAGPPGGSAVSLTQGSPHC
jgi:hypothetical protein